MLRWIAGGLLLAALVAGCGDPDQQLRESAAQAAREAVSEVGTARLVVEQLRAGHEWSPFARVMVEDAEKNLAKVVDSFAAEQPSTESSGRLYEQVNSTLATAESAVTAVRIALGGSDLPAAERQLTMLRQSGAALARLEGLAR